MTRKIIRDDTIEMFINSYFFGYIKDHVFHRIDGPAIIWFSVNIKEYWIDGKLVSKEQQEFYYDLLKLKNIEEK